jgi:hypothetical protein
VITAADIRWELAQIPDPVPPVVDDSDALLERIVDLTIERDVYRALAQELLEALHQTQLERDVLREQRSLDRRHERDRQGAA